MPQESGEIVVALTRLGDGQVVLDIPADMIYEAEGQQPSRIPGPPSPRAQNFRLMDGIATLRPGLGAPVSVTGISRQAAKITGAANCIFDDETSTAIIVANEISAGVALTRITGTTLDGTTGIPSTPGSDVTPVAPNVPTAAAENYWSFAPVRRSGSASPQNQWMAVNGKDSLYYWIGSGKFLIVDATNAPKGGKVLFGYQGRAYVCNTLDGSSNRKNSRMERSGVGDPLDWTGATVGTVDLDDDPYPISAANIIAGAPTIYKGNNTGGTIIRATPTGSVNEPLRFDTVSTDLGILCPRSLVPISQGTNFFIGQDGLYLHDGLRGLKAIAPHSSRALIRAINQNALQGTYAYYRPYTKEIVMSIATGDLTVPTETWVYNTELDKLYGPWIYGVGQPTATAIFADIGGVSWNTLVGTWDSQTSSWDNLGAGAASFGFFHGNNNGQIFYDADIDGTQDDGQNVSGEYRTGWIHARGRQMLVQRQPVTLDVDDMLSLYDVTISYRASGAWTPTVQVLRAEDGSSRAAGTVISDGVALAAGKGQLKRVRYNGSLPKTSRAFQIYLGGTGNIQIEGISVRMKWGGNEFADTTN